MATEAENLTEAERIALRIRQVREITGKTQVEFASAVGVSRSYLSEVEAKKSKPSIEMILGVTTEFPEIASPYWLLLGYGGPGPYSDDSKQFPKIDVKCLTHALNILGSGNLPDQVINDQSERVKALALFINSYSVAYHAMLLSGHSEKEARSEAEGRCDQIASMLTTNYDALIAQGPNMAF